jgi:hypothetical protein
MAGKPAGPSHVGLALVRTPVRADDEHLGRASGSMSATTRSVALTANQDPITTPDSFHAQHGPTVLGLTWSEALCAPR